MLYRPHATHKLDWISIDVFGILGRQWASAKYFIII